MNLRSVLRSEATDGRRGVIVDGGTASDASTGIGAGSCDGAGSDGKIAAGTGGVMAMPPLKFSQKVLAQAMVSGVWRAYQHLVLPVYRHARLPRKGASAASSGRRVKWISTPRILSFRHQAAVMGPWLAPVSRPLLKADCTTGAP